MTLRSVCYNPLLITWIKQNTLCMYNYMKSEVVITEHFVSTYLGAKKQNKRLVREKLNNYSTKFYMSFVFEIPAAQLYTRTV